MSSTITAPVATAAALRFGRLAALAGLGLLVALGLAWELWLAPTGRGTLALKVLPLLFLVVGLMLHRLNAYRALSLLVWVYVLEGSFRAGFETGLSQILAVAQAALAVALFTVCVLYIRRRFQGTQA